MVMQSARECNRISSCCRFLAEVYTEWSSDYLLMNKYEQSFRMLKLNYTNIYNTKKCQYSGQKKVYQVRRTKRHHSLQHELIFEVSTMYLSQSLQSLKCLILYLSSYRTSFNSGIFLRTLANSFIWNNESIERCTITCKYFYWETFPRAEKFLLLMIDIYKKNDMYDTKKDITYIHSLLYQILKYSVIV